MAVYAAGIRIDKGPTKDEEKGVEWKPAAVRIVDPKEVLSLYVCSAQIWCREDPTWKSLIRHLV